MTPFLVAALFAWAPAASPTVERWGLFELSLTGPPDDGSSAPFELKVTAAFQRAGGAALTVSGFFDGGDVYKVRFAPPDEGVWSYVTASSSALLDKHAGNVTATAPSAGNHGPVKSRGFGLYHADGTPHFSVGTTSYQWASMPRAQQEQTLATLRQNYFNKMRMTVFPKWYVYNHQNPVEAGTAYEIKPGSLAANASVWGCVGASCPD
eukprot:7277883-Prymnesium_polylepis.1